MNTNSLPIVVYSHSDYLPILKIQTEYVQKFDNKILFINRTELNEIESLYAYYDEVYTYDDTLPYASRVLSCLNSIKNSHILFIHDIDIILDCDIDFLHELLELMYMQSLDRIDLKYTPKFDLKEEIKITDKIVAVKQTNPNYYIYNVNPSIWKVSAFKEILSAYKDRTYRNIEDMDVQHFCINYKIYKIYSDSFLKCGYYNCVDFFKFLHISHNGKILSLNDTFVTEYGQSYEDVKNEFRTIIDRYGLKNTNLWKQ